MRIGVIGGGASGMFCAGGLAKKGHQVILFEKNEKTGKKIYITGKGRCNLTNACDTKEFLDNVVSNSKFLMSSAYGFTSQDCIDFFNNLGLKTKIERGNRVFPLSDKSSDVIKVLNEYMYDNGVEVKLNCKVLDIKICDAKVCGVVTSCGEYAVDAVVLATGGITYPSTGSSGDGYIMAKKSGHNIIRPHAGLVPMLLDENLQLAGLSLKNVSLSVIIDNKSRYSQFGEMLFTHTGVSGPLVLSASSAVGKFAGKNNLFSKGSFIEIDLKPALSEDVLQARIQREIEACPNCELKTLLATLMPKALVPVVADKSGMSVSQKLNSITRNQRLTLAKTIKSLRFKLKGLDRDDLGIITQGGVDVKQVNPKSMQSKITEGLYFAGEILDVDAYTGGFNLQIAFCSAKSVVDEL